MQPIKQAAADFLANQRVAVTGVSRTAGGHGGNVVYQRLRERGYSVFAVNPNAEEVEGDPSYPDLRSIPDGVDAVVIATRPDEAEATMRECAELGIRHVWMHKGPGPGSVCDEATVYGRERGITVIFVTHDPEIAEQTRRIIHIRDGLIEWDEALAGWAGD